LGQRVDEDGVLWPFTEERDVDLPAQQCCECVVEREFNERARRRRDAVGGDERSDDHRHAAPRLPGGDPASPESGEIAHLSRSAVEHPQRRVGDAGNVHEAPGVGLARDARHQETRLGASVRFAQQREVVADAARDLHVQRHSVAREDVAIAKRELVERAALGTGRERDAARRNRLEEMEREPDACREQRDERDRDRQQRRP